MERPSGWADEAKLDETTRLDLYRKQSAIRQFEQRAYDLFLQNLVKGTSNRPPVPCSDSGRSRYVRSN